MDNSIMINAKFSPDQAAQLDDVQDQLREERPGAWVTRSDALRFCVQATWQEKRKET